MVANNQAEIAAIDAVSLKLKLNMMISLKNSKSLPGQSQLQVCLTLLIKTRIKVSFSRPFNQRSPTYRMTTAII